MESLKIFVKTYGVLGILIYLISFILSISMFIYLSNKYTINVPLWDDYDQCLDFLNKYITSKTFYDKFLLLIGQHNEHIIAIPRLIDLIYYKFFGNINFRYLIFFSQFILIAAIYPYSWLLNKINPSQKIFNFVFAIVLITCPSTCGSFVWLGASLQQNSQILFSLFSILYLIKIKDNLLTSNYCIYTIFMILNAFTGGGWVILFPSVILYCLLKKQYKLFIFNSIFFILVALFLFKVFPYTFIKHQFTTFSQLGLFILGFTGSTFFSGSGEFYDIPFIIGFIIILLCVFKYRSIIKNPVYLIWFIFFFANSVIIGFGRLWTGSVGLDDKYAIYSLLNMGFIINLLVPNRANYTKYCLIIVFSTLNIFSFIKQIDDNSWVSYRKNIANNELNYPHLSRALDVYKISKKLNIYKSSVVDNIVGKMEPFNAVKSPYNYSNIEVKCNLNDIKVEEDGSYIKVEGWAFVNEYSSNQVTKYLRFKSSEHEYWFMLEPSYRPDITKNVSTKLNQDYAGFHRIIPLENIPPGNYTLSIYVSGNKVGNFCKIDKPHTFTK